MTWDLGVCFVWGSLPPPERKPGEKPPERDQTSNSMTWERGVDIWCYTPMSCGSGWTDVYEGIMKACFLNTCMRASNFEILKLFILATLDG